MRSRTIVISWSPTDGAESCRSPNSRPRPSQRRCRKSNRRATTPSTCLPQNCKHACRSFSLKLSSHRLFLSRFAALQGLRRLQVLLKRRQRVLGEARHIVAALGLLLELFDVLLVVGHHVLGEFLVKGLP